MIRGRLLKILNEARSIENAPSVSNSTSFEGIKEIAADALNLNPSDMTIGLVPAKESLADFLDFKKTGDIWISFKTSVEDTDSIARELNGFNFLDQIVVNGETGRDLSAIVSDGTTLAGNIVITTKSSEAQIRLFLPHLGGEVSEEAFERYWAGIGGKCIGEQTIERVREQMAQLAGGRGVRGAIRGRRNRGYLREEGIAEGYKVQVGNNGAIYDYVWVDDDSFLDELFRVTWVSGQYPVSWGSSDPADDVDWSWSVKIKPTKFKSTGKPEDLALDADIEEVGEREATGEDAMDLVDSIYHVHLDQGISIEKAFEMVAESWVSDLIEYYMESKANNFDDDRRDYYRDMELDESESLNELGDSTGGQYMMGRVAGRAAKRGNFHKALDMQDHAVRNLPKRVKRGSAEEDLYKANHKGYEDEIGLKEAEKQEVPEDGAWKDDSEFIQAVVGLDGLEETYTWNMVRSNDPQDDVDWQVKIAFHSEGFGNDPDGLDLWFSYDGDVESGWVDDEEYGEEDYIVERLYGEWCESQGSVESLKHAIVEWLSEVNEIAKEREENKQSSSYLEEEQIDKNHKWESWKDDSEFIQALAGLDGTEAEGSWSIYVDRYNGGQDDIDCGWWVQFHSKDFGKSHDVADLWIEYDTDHGSGKIDVKEWWGEEIPEELYYVWTHESGNRQEAIKKYLVDYYLGEDDGESGAAGIAYDLEITRPAEHRAAEYDEYINRSIDRARGL